MCEEVVKGWKRSWATDSQNSSRGYDLADKSLNVNIWYAS